MDIDLSFFHMHYIISPKKNYSLLDRIKAQLIKLKTAMEHILSKLAIEKIINNLLTKF